MIILFYFSVTGIYNYNLDPYGILETRKEFVGIRPNEHSLKVHYVLQNTHKFNSFLFSNSKGGVLYFNELNNETNTWYNMTYSLGTAEEFYDDIILFLKNNVEIKNIVVGLDEGVIYERASSHKNQASRKFVSMETQSLNWEFLFLPVSFKKFLHINLDKKHVIHDIYNNGNYYAKNAYANDCDFFAEIVLRKATKEDIKSVLDFASQIKTLKKIRNLCQEKNINLLIRA